MPKRTAPKETLAKSIAVFLLEDVLFPGVVNSTVDKENTKKVLKQMKKFAKTHPEFKWYGVSGLKTQVCLEKIREFELEEFFPGEKVLAVNDAFINKMEEVDRGLYEKKCENDRECKDEYYRQVALQELMQKENVTAEKVLLVGHDYWFDGFYTRRFSKVDTAFVQASLSSKGHLAQERVQGLWYIDFSWNDIQSILEGKTSAPEYKYLDTFIVTSISKELFGGQGFTLQKKVLDLRDLKKQKDN